MTTSLAGLSPLYDKTRDLFLGRHEGARACYVYVDNLGVIAKTQQVAHIVARSKAKASQSYMSILMLMPGACFGITDIKDCFHNMLIPEWLSGFFSLIPVTAKERGWYWAAPCCRMVAKLCLKLKRWYLLRGRLPMGCSWSLYFAQSVTEAIASRATSLAGLSLLHD